MNQTESSAAAPISGLLFGLTAFLIWGLSPVYWKELKQVQAIEIIQHRIVWSFFLLIPIIILRGRWQEFLTAIKTPRSLALLTASALLVSTNWFLYIWAVSTDHLIQASLGYYINPLVNILLGTVFLKERLRRLQLISVTLAAMGVLYMTFYVGQFPWISLTLAFTFGLYGLIRKTVNVPAMAGLAVETLLLSFPAGAYMIILVSEHRGSFLTVDLRTDLFLIGASVVTTVPLLLFTIAARRLNLSTVGFMQYLAPTCMFLLGIFLYHEPFSTAQVVMFVMIWIALTVYSLDSVQTYRKN